MSTIQATSCAHLLATAAAAISTAGCSLLNPYVRATALDVTDGGSASGTSNTVAAVNQPLQTAIQVAAAQRKEYYDAVSTRAKVRNGLPLVLVPLSALAIYKGLTGADTEAGKQLVLKEGLLGASAYGLATYYTSSTRELVYLAGAKAMSCSIYAVTPFFLPDELGEALAPQKIRELQEALATLRTNNRDVADMTAAAVVRYGAAAETSPLLAGSRGQVVRAKSTANSAQKVLDASLDLRSTVSGTSARLRMTIETIVAQVDEQISRLEPDISAIAAIPATLSTTALKLAPSGTFTPAPEAPKAPAAGIAAAAALMPFDIDVREINDRAASLPASISAVEIAAATMQYAVDAAARRIKGAPRLESCQVPKSPVALDISPPDDVIEMRPRDIRQFRVKSGTGIPGYGLDGTIGTTAGVPLSLRSQVEGNWLVVTATYDAAVADISSVTLTFTDGSSLGGKKSVTIALLPDGHAPASAPAAAPTKFLKGPGPAPAPAPAPPAGATAFESKLSAVRIGALQTKLAVPVTGTLDTATKAAVLKWKKDNKWNGPEDASVTEPFLKALQIPS